MFSLCISRPTEDTIELWRDTTMHGFLALWSLNLHNEPRWFNCFSAMSWGRTLPGNYKSVFFEKIAKERAQPEPRDVAGELRRLENFIPPTKPLVEQNNNINKIQPNNRGRGRGRGRGNSKFFTNKYLTKLGICITLVKWCFSAGKSVFAVAPAIVQWPTLWPTSRAKCLPDPQQQQKHRCQ